MVLNTGITVPVCHGMTEQALTTLSVESTVGDLEIDRQHRTVWKTDNKVMRKNYLCKHILGITDTST
jgi:hypothetical protein